MPLDHLAHKLALTARARTPRNWWPLFRWITIAVTGGLFWALVYVLLVVTP